MFLFRKHKTTQHKAHPKSGSTGWRPKTFCESGSPLSIVSYNRPFDQLPKNQAGDFGTIDKITGELFVEGNIFTHQDIANTAMKYPASGCTEDDLVEIPSNEVLPLNVKTEARA